VPLLHLPSQKEPVRGLNPLGSFVPLAEPPPHDALNENARSAPAHICPVDNKSAVHGLDLVRGGIAAKDFVDRKDLGEEAATHSLPWIRTKESDEAKQKIITASDRHLHGGIERGQSRERAPKLRS
jgi:hypothetical protein